MTTQLYLTSSIGTPGVAKDIRAKIGGSKPLKTAFITTPVEPPSEQEDLEWYELDRQALQDGGFNFFDYTITNKTLSQIKSDLADIDALYISGGNTNYLLYHSGLSGFTDWVKDYVVTGKPYLGTSAGSIITGPSLPLYLWNEHESAPELTSPTTYRLVNFTIIPHWGSKYFQDLYLKERLQQVYNERSQPFIFLTDCQYVEVRDDWYRIVDVKLS